MKVLVIEKALSKIRIKLAVLYLLNVIDIVFTLLFVETEYFIELNPFMKNIVQDSTSALVIKCVIPAVLLGYLAIRLQKANEKQINISNYIINIILLAYIAINVMHIVSLTIYKVNGLL